MEGDRSSESRESPRNGVSGMGAGVLSATSAGGPRSVTCATSPASRAGKRRMP